ncbi:MAG: DUF305 domain-containing protein [Gemmatimonadaceae bacterium]
MTPSRIAGIATVLATVALAAVSTARPAAAQIVAIPSADMPGEAAARAKARTDSARYPYTKADIDFMTGMIGHHSQAIVMADMAPTHGASPSVLTLADRIKNAQRDEIHTMQQWLVDRNQPAPDGHSPMRMDMGGSGMNMDMSDTSHAALMPGMLTQAQLKQLDAARGPDFDRLFLTFMIQHHTGALTMVRTLFDSYGAAQDLYMFKYASDVNVDQTTEIARMKRMLVAMMFTNGSQ